MISNKRPHGHLLACLALALLLSGCADKSKSGAKGPSMLSSVKNMLTFTDDNTPRASVTPLLGDLQGYTFGNTMDKNDLARLNDILANSRSRQTTQWDNTNSGYHYTITPYPAFQDDNHRYCREIAVESLANGRTENIRTVACRRADGQWDVQG